MITSLINYSLQPSKFQVITLLKWSDLIYPYVREAKGELYLLTLLTDYLSNAIQLSVSSLPSPLFFQLLK